jgi:hypothetical protein
MSAPSKAEKKAREAQSKADRAAAHKAKEAYAKMGPERPAHLQERKPKAEKQQQGLSALTGLQPQGLQEKVGSTNLPGDEIAFQVEAPLGTSIRVHPVNPGDLDLFKRGSVGASIWSCYDPNKSWIEFEFVPMVSVATPIVSGGSEVCLAWSPDPDVYTPPDWTNLLSIAPKTFGITSLGRTLRVSGSSFNRRAFRVRTAGFYEGGDSNDYDVGALIIGTKSLTAGMFVGELRVRYNWALRMQTQVMPGFRTPRRTALMGKLMVAVPSSVNTTPTYGSTGGYFLTRFGNGIDDGGAGEINLKGPGVYRCKCTIDPNPPSSGAFTGASILAACPTVPGSIEFYGEATTTFLVAAAAVQTDFSINQEIVVRVAPGAIADLTYSVVQVNSGAVATNVAIAVIIESLDW